MLTDAHMLALRVCEMVMSAVRKALTERYGCIIDEYGNDITDILVRVYTSKIMNGFYSNMPVLR